MSVKNKTLRAFLHQNENPTPQQIWDAAWNYQARQAARESEGGEAVAWQWRGKHGDGQWRDCDPDAVRYYQNSRIHDVRELYTHPPKQQSGVPGMGSNEINEASWRFIEALPQGDFRAAVAHSPHIKPAIHAAAEYLLSTTPQPDKWIPKGWKVVPVESTEDMDEYGARVAGVSLTAAEFMWNAMLAVAPSPPEQEPNQ